ncbi:hypothetical protein A2X44_03595 [candidate division CPR3 bacterium GWF2_35_18]|uniref:Uncharacterized protein n=1 Tax=candidate division CPR3 bacterium GW2011_GWF2_35_18 TaxID=1618350 RepID=A0A0G0C0I0_UNCC3|nr:MAG: hypothetical protein UR67_C0004G0008 [candidate division CPR3 bacterium GW2011_GWF2_35_18]KKP86238.1 MAG: hypothetical protein UR87_C0025G0008 [candidate division CPR3 bacterium GW2011_GWE2_35_7]OGB63098.1 MAG: hypothetical protein A2X44_03595 [candidate division CPR3 bacterium GWF2_35_18]OGB64088.1 MAG: hypothetical protein A2250_04795 [candidate division CPR3 bacterium RIFOXYA2_FULL_35_13]OGB75840.1 MAG: hypothetical protein A2476_00595 [candidate division CPR3 bacterium RIFOXYC2_FULL
MPTDCKGYVLVDLLKIVKDRLGDGGLKKFAEVNGNANYLGAKIYNEEEVIKFFKSLSIVVFGDDSKKNLVEAGKLLAQIHISSKVFATMINLISQRIFSGFLFSQKTNKLLQNSITSISPSLEVKVESLDDKNLRITFYNTKIPVEIFYGEWVESISYLKINALVSYQILSRNSFYLVLSKK